ncbi:hypothetical protein ACLBWT_20890 [Paenibacillus sp. D51F]
MTSRVQSEKPGVLRNRMVAGQEAFTKPAQGKDKSTPGTPKRGRLQVDD